MLNISAQCTCVYVCRTWSSFLCSTICPWRSGQRRHFTSSHTSLPLSPFPNYTPPLIVTCPRIPSSRSSFFFFFSSALICLPHLKICLCLSSVFLLRPLSRTGPGNDCLWKERGEAGRVSWPLGVGWREYRAVNGHLDNGDDNDDDACKSGGGGACVGLRSTVLEVWRWKLQQ